MKQDKKQEVLIKMFGLLGIAEGLKEGVEKETSVNVGILLEKKIDEITDDIRKL